MKKDVVCGMRVDEKDAKKSLYKSKTYFFCSYSCKTAFEESPQDYAR